MSYDKIDLEDWFEEEPSNVKTYIAFVFIAIFSALVLKAILQQQEIINHQKEILSAINQQSIDRHDFDYTRLLEGVMGGDEFPVVKNGWFKCVRVITE